MKTTCTTCSQHIEIDSETLVLFKGMAHFERSAYSSGVSVPAVVHLQLLALSRSFEEWIRRRQQGGKNFATAGKKIRKLRKPASHPGEIHHSDENQYIQPTRSFSVSDTGASLWKCSNYQHLPTQEANRLEVARSGYLALGFGYFGDRLRNCLHGDRTHFAAPCDRTLVARGAFQRSSLSVVLPAGGNARRQSGISVLAARQVLSSSYRLGMRPALYWLSADLTDEVRRDSPVHSTGSRQSSRANSISIHPSSS